MSIEEIRGRLEAATPGPWCLSSPRPDGRNMVERPGYDLYGGEISEMIIVDTNPSDAEFIAHAPEDMRRLLSAVEAVEKLHQPRHDTVSALYPIPLCSCEQADYPCETVKAITSALEAS